MLQSDRDDIFGGFTTAQEMEMGSKEEMKLMSTQCATACDQGQSAETCQASGNILREKNTGMGYCLSRGLGEK